VGIDPPDEGAHRDRTEIVQQLLYNGHCDFQAESSITIRRCLLERRVSSICRAILRRTGFHFAGLRSSHWRNGPLVRTARVELATSVWKTDTLPLRHARQVYAVCGLHILAEDYEHDSHGATPVALGLSF
jgi:hypothetical protein